MSCTLSTKEEGKRMINLALLQRCVAVLAKLGIEANPAHAFKIETRQDGDLRYIPVYTEEDIYTTVANLYEALEEPRTILWPKSNREAALQDMHNAIEHLTAKLRYARMLLDTPFEPLQKHTEQ